MRPPRHAQSAFRTPLNTLLGTEAAVRVLRALAAAEGTPLAAGELAERAGLHRTSVYPVLEHLEGQGVVGFIGAGAQRLVRLDPTHWATDAIHTIFASERRRVTTVLSRLQLAARALRPAPTAVWLEGAVARGTDRGDEPFPVRVLADPAALPALTEQLRVAVADVEAEFDVVVEVSGLTRSELAHLPSAERAALRDVILLAGVPPHGLAGRSPRDAAQRHDHAREAREGHARHDERGLRLAAAVAAKLRRDPGLIREATAYLDARLASASARERSELEEWRRLLDTLSPARLRQFLLDPGPRATRLRQSSPFAAALTPAERDAALAATSVAAAARVVARTGARAAASGRIAGRGRRT